MKKVTTLSLLILAFNAFAQRVSGPISEQTQRALPALPEGALFFEGFENGNFGNLSQYWTSSSLSNKTFYTGISGTMEGQANENGFWPVPKHGIFAMTNDDACNCDKSDDQLTSKTFDLRGLEKVTFGFEAFQNGAGNQIAWVEFYEPNSGWTTVKSISASTAWQAFEIEVSNEFLTSAFQFRFRYSDQGNYASGLALDNIYLREGYLGRVKLLNYYAIDGEDEQSTFLYESLPLSQAKFANFQLGAKVKNETSTKLDMRLSSVVVTKQFDTSATWSVYPNETVTLKTDYNHRFTPTSTGNFIFTSQALAATNESALFPISLTKLGVSDSLYYRVNPTSDGTGIWLQADNDEIGTVFHLFKTDTIKSVNIDLHASTAVNSAFQVLIYQFDNLDSAIYNSEIQLISTQDFPGEYRVKVDSVFAKGKYVISIKRLSGNTVISTRQDRAAKFGEVIYKSNNWNRFAYFPFVSLVFPMENENCNGTIVGDIQKESCPGMNDASIDLSRSTFGMTSTITWSNGASGINAGNLQPGNYTVTVNDTNGCFYQKTFEIAAAEQLSFIATLSSDLCGKGVGAILMNSTGGTKPYFYTLTNEQISSRLEHLSGGNYEITLTDIRGCSISETFIVQSSDTILLNANITLPDCGVSNGEIAMTASGTAPFQYTWENGSLDSTLSGLVAAIYNVTVTDALGCTKDSMIILNNANAASIAAFATEPTCTNSDDGNIDITMTGGTQPFNFLWSNDSTTEDAKNLTEGIYTVTAEDAASCQTFFSTNLIAEHKSPLLNLTAQGGLCGASGSVIKALVCDSLSTSINWSTGSTNNEIENLVTGNYYITVTNAAGCTSLDSANILARDSISIVFDSLAYIIDSIGFNRALVFVTVSGGTPAYTFSWSNGFTEEDLVTKDTGDFSLNVIDQFGCAASASTTIKGIPTGIENFSLKNPSVKTYPNPFSGSSFRIESDIEIATLHVQDISGKMIKATLSNSLGGIRVNIPENTAPGIYICTLQFVNNQNTHVTLVKLR